MNKSLILAGLLASTTSMMALDSQYFLGAGIEYGSFDSVKTNSENNALNDKDSTLKLKGGAILNQNHRLSLSHANFKDGNTNLRTILGAYDYLVYLQQDVNLYGGVHLGNAEYKNISDNAKNLKVSDWAYGLQVGGLYDITRNIELDVGLAYTKYDVDKTIIDGNETYRIGLDDSTSISTGINYKF